MRILVTAFTLMFVLCSNLQANSLTDLYRSGATAIVEQSSGHFDLDFIDDLASTARVLSNKEVRKILKIKKIDPRIVYVKYDINDCVIQTAVVAILPGTAEIKIWYFDSDNEQY